MRTFKEVGTGKIFSLVVDNYTKEWKLIYFNNSGPEDMANGTEVNGFYLNNTGADVFIKLQDKQVKKVPTGYFLNIDPDNQPTHKKIGKRFIKYSLG
jgi:hypothetical protein